MSAEPTDGSFHFLRIAEPIRREEVAKIADLYPSKGPDEKRAMIEQSLDSDFAGSLERRRTILLARIGGVLVGTVQVVWEDPAEEPELLPPGAAVIHHFRTHPDHRRRGIGLRLMDEAERLARGRRVEALTLGVEPANELAHRLYETWGFRDFLSYRGSEGEPIIGMKKALAPI
jgi:ribosomal protein S18 acetylase RimI-like enzyme